MFDLFIVAAGKGTRMGSNIPKALMEIDGIPNVLNTIEKALPYYDRIFVVTNVDIQREWDHFFTHVCPQEYPVFNIAIESGLGDGHAVMMALKQDDLLQFSSDISIVWGDAYIPDERMFGEMLSRRHRNCLPVQWEDNPYVAIMGYNFQAEYAKFSKYGENENKGYHDQSMFRFETSDLEYALQNLDCCFWKHDKYITASGELSLLFVLHFLANKNKPMMCYETQYGVHGFNTPQELHELKEKYDSNK